VDMIDDLVQLTVSEVPLAYNHPDAEVTSKLLFHHGYVRQQTCLVLLLTRRWRCCCATRFAR
jgi:hypothetical protein